MFYFYLQAKKNILFTSVHAAYKVCLDALLFLSNLEDCFQIVFHHCYHYTLIHWQMFLSRTEWKKIVTCTLLLATKVFLLGHWFKSWFIVIAQNQSMNNIGMHKQYCGWISLSIFLIYLWVKQNISNWIWLALFLWLCEQEAPSPHSNF